MMDRITALRAAARDAYVSALPMSEIAVVRAALLGAGLPAGRFFPQRGLATPRDRWVTTPNVDTIYTNAFIDLSNGPAELTVPALGDRYASVALMDMYSDHIAVLGTRTTGQDGGRFILVGPNAPAPDGVIRSPTNWVWALARVVVNGPDDVPAALAILHGFDCAAAPATAAPSPGADRNGPWQDWLAAANALMRENPAPATDRAMLARMAPLGLGRAAFDPAGFSADESAAIAAGIADAKAQLRVAGFGGRRTGAWIYPAPNIGDFGQDYLTRAQIAVAGLAALPAAEAIYLAAVSPDGGLFDGDGPWHLHFPAGQLPPVGAFWSLTMYEAEANGAFFLTGNEIDRYTIGDRTPHLSHGPDGSLDIWIARTDPVGDRSANWLPAPAAGPFIMILRCYLPSPDILAQAYVPPAIVRN